METSQHFSSDVAFTPSVKAQQSLKGSRRTYERMEKGGSWETKITPDLKEFIEEQTSFFMSTANAAGQPYIQHRGGPAGFLRVIDDSTIGFADYAGNRQYITLGNLAENPLVHLFLIDYAERSRIKIWGKARVVEDDPELTARLMPPGYKARPERALLISVTAWDVNCRQHIPQLIAAEEVSRALAERDRRIATLEAEVSRLKGGPSMPAGLQQA